MFQQLLENNERLWVFVDSLLQYFFKKIVVWDINLKFLAFETILLLILVATFFTLQG